MAALPPGARILLGQRLQDTSWQGMMPRVRLVQSNRVRCRPLWWKGAWARVAEGLLLL